MKRKNEEIRQLTIPEIMQKVSDLQKEIYAMRYQSQTSRVEKPHRFRQIRKEIARCKTIAREKEISNAERAQKQR